MVRDIMGLMEILSFLYMVAAVYNVKMKYNIYTVVFIVSELFLLSGINNHGFSPYFLGLSYLFMFIYCLVNYNSGVKKTIVNCVLASIAISIVQMLCYFMVTFIGIKFLITVEQKEMSISILYLVITLALSKNFRLAEMSEFLLKRNKLLYAIGIFILIVFGSQMLGMKKEHYIDGRYGFSVAYFALILVLLVWEWQKTRGEAEKRKAQLELNRIYYEAYEGLIHSIRERQHDFKNHLNAIEGMIYSTDSYDELVTQQKKYLQSISGNMELTKLLTLVENPLIAGFLNYKVSSAQKIGIDARYNCILPKCEMKIPEFQIVEMMGILLDNALEEMESKDLVSKILDIELETENNKLKFTVANTYDDSSINIAKIFESGYSGKGSNRGIGLSKLKHMINENNGEICVLQEKIDDIPVLRIQLAVNI